MQEIKIKKSYNIDWKTALKVADSYIENHSTIEKIPSHNFIFASILDHEIQIIKETKKDTREKVEGHWLTCKKNKNSYTITIGL